MRLYAFFAFLTVLSFTYVGLFPSREGQNFIALAVLIQPIVLGIYENFIVHNKYKRNP